MQCVMLGPIWSLGLLVLGVGHNWGIYFTFPFMSNLWISIPTFICSCDVIVLPSFGIFCLQRILGPLGATLGPYTLKGAQHVKSQFVRRSTTIKISLKCLLNWLVLYWGFVVVLCENYQKSACEPFFLALFFMVSLWYLYWAFHLYFLNLIVHRFVPFLVKVHACQGALCGVTTRQLWFWRILLSRVVVVYLWHW